MKFNIRLSPSIAERNPYKHPLSSECRHRVGGRIAWKLTAVFNLEDFIKNAIRPPFGQFNGELVTPTGKT